jgi:hypothetical protein
MNIHEVPSTHNEAASEDAVLVVQLSKLRTSAKELASKTGSHRNVVKDVESKGLVPRIGKEELAIAESGDASKKLAELQTLIRYLRLLGVELPNDQLDLFGPNPMDLPIVDKATDDGLRAGRLGETIETCPHDPSTAAYRAWRDGHQIGSREREQILAMPAPLFRKESDDPETDDFDDALEEG